MLAISLASSISSSSLAKTFLDEASMEEQLQFFEFLAHSLVKDKKVITPIDLEQEESLLDSVNSEETHKGQDHNADSFSQQEESLQ